MTVRKNVWAGWWGGERAPGTNRCIQISILSGDLYSYTRRWEYFVYLHNVEHSLMHYERVRIQFDHANEIKETFAEKAPK
jgi:hypothetical protein